MHYPTGTLHIACTEKKNVALPYAVGKINMRSWNTWKVYVLEAFQHI